MTSTATHPAPLPPLLLAFDSLLASSWTLFALLLAAIAATLRALRVGLRRLPSHPETACLTGLSPISHSPTSRACDDAPFPSSVPLHRRPQQRRRCASAPALGKLWLSTRGRSCRRVFSSILDPENRTASKRTPSESQICRCHHECDQAHQRLGQDAADILLTKAAAPSAGPAWEGSSRQRRSNNDEVQNEDGASLLSLWARSFSPLLTRSSTPLPCARDLSFVNAAFERQFGWDRLLDAKLGLPWTLSWRSHAGWSGQGRRNNVVRTWDDLPKKLVRKLDLDDRYISALDAQFEEGLACTGSVSGEISLWELERRAFAKESTTFPQPVLALSMNSELHATAVASATSFGLWDRRSPRLELHVSSMTAGTTVSEMNSRGGEVCFYTDEGKQSMYDLRKPSRGTLLVSAVPQGRRILSKPEDEQSRLWEKYTRTDDAADDAEGDFVANEQESVSSWLSTLAKLVKAVTLTS